MSTKYKRRSLDEVLFENEYLLILAYSVFLLFSLIVFVLRTLKEKIVVR